MSESTFNGSRCPDPGCGGVMFQPDSYMFTIHVYLLGDGRWQAQKLLGAHNDSVECEGVGATVREAIERLLAGAS